jgi:aminomethyltransferase
MQSMLSPLNDEHIKLKGKLVEFAGWLLPLHFSGTVTEHEWVRNSCGIFDVSHMGEIFIKGKDSSSFLNSLVCSDLDKLVDGDAKYTALLNQSGGVIDDIIVHRITKEEWFLCVNGANRESVLSWLKQHLKGEVVLSDETFNLGLIALQGPKAVEVIKLLFPESKIESLKRFKFNYFKIPKIESEVIISRTGYTGEDGFEFYVHWNDAPKLWNILLDCNLIKPIGLGARDTLRLEAGLPLHGSDLSSEWSILSSNVHWIVAKSKSFFIGKEAISDEIHLRPEMRRFSTFGIELNEPGIARHHDIVSSSPDHKAECGFVTSGTWSPMLQKAIALVRTELNGYQLGDKIWVKVRSKSIPATIVKLPFY